MGQSGPQLPHLLWPPTWWPTSSTNVEHHGLCSVRWAISQIHVVWVTPLNRKGKMQGKFGLAPDSVVQTGFLELSSLVDSAFLRATLDSEKWKKKYVQIHLDRKKSPWEDPLSPIVKLQQARWNGFVPTSFLGRYSRPGNRATLGLLRTYFYYCRTVGLVPAIPYPPKISSSTIYYNYRNRYQLIVVSSLHSPIQRGRIFFYSCYHFLDFFWHITSSWL